MRLLAHMESGSLGPSAAPPAADQLAEVRVVEAQELAACSAEWEALSAEALEPNPFYEPWMALPAAEAFGQEGLRFVLVLLHDPSRRSAPPTLGAVFPLELAGTCRGLPSRALRAWKYEHCFLCTPLLRARSAGACIGAFLDWLQQDGCGRWLLELDSIPAEGAFARLLVEQLRRRQVMAHAPDLFTRPILRPHASVEQYLQQVVPARRRTDLRRCERRLAAAGRHEFRVIGAEASQREREQLIEQFLQIEASGWKGRQGTAMASTAQGAAFYRAMAREAWARGRLLMYHLRLEGRTIAMTTVLLSGDGAFSFKIAFDEAYAACSPGVLLWMHEIADLHHRPEVRWMDSCAAPDYGLLGELLSDRRAMQNLVMSTGRAPGDLLLASMPLMRWTRRTLRQIARPRAAV